VDTSEPSPPGVMGGSDAAPVAMYAVGAYGAMGVLAGVGPCPSAPARGASPGDSEPAMWRPAWIPDKDRRGTQRRAKPWLVTKDGHPMGAWPSGPGWSRTRPLTVRRCCSAPTRASFWQRFLRSRRPPGPARDRSEHPRRGPRRALEAVVDRADPRFSPNAPRPSGSRSSSITTSPAGRSTHRTSYWTTPISGPGPTPTDALCVRARR